MCQEVGLDREQGWGRVVAHWQTMQSRDRQIAQDITSIKAKALEALRS